MTTRIVLSLIVILGCTAAGWIYRSVQGPYVADIALQQMENDDEAAAAGRAAATENIDGILLGAAVVLLALIWIPVVVRIWRHGAVITVPHIEVRSTKPRNQAQSPSGSGQVLTEEEMSS